jgi:hypothetical protein
MVTVPFNDEWTKSGNTVDVKAIYRRPGPGINLTGPLPVKRHSDYISPVKNFTYVSLASAEDINRVAADLRKMGLDPTEFRPSYPLALGGHFDTVNYIRELLAEDAARLVRLEEQVRKYGSAMVVEMMRNVDATFTLPAHLQDITPAPAPTAEVVAEAPKAPARRPVETAAR